MVQVKKTEVRDAVLDSAFACFCVKGYAPTTLAEIAAGAGVATSNVYVYFGSKIEVLFAVYGPWLTEQLDDMARRAAAIDDPRKRLRHILFALWRDIPAKDNGFAHTLMQAISISQPDEGYSRELLLLSESRISDLIRQCLPADRRHLVDDDLLSHVLFMAFDGFVLNHRLVGPSRRIGGIVELMCDLLIPDR